MTFLKSDFAEILVFPSQMHIVDDPKNPRLCKAQLLISPRVALMIFGDFPYVNTCFLGVSKIQILFESENPTLCGVHRFEKP